MAVPDERCVFHFLIERPSRTTRSNSRRSVNDLPGRAPDAGHLPARKEDGRNGRKRERDTSPHHTHVRRGDSVTFYRCPPRSRGNESSGRCEQAACATTALMATGQRASVPLADICRLDTHRASPTRDTIPSPLRRSSAGASRRGARTTCKYARNRARARARASVSVRILSPSTDPTRRRVYHPGRRDQTRADEVAR